MDKTSGPASKAEAGPGEQPVIITVNKENDRFYINGCEAEVKAILDVLRNAEDLKIEIDFAGGPCG